MKGANKIRKTAFASNIPPKDITMCLTDFSCFFMRFEKKPVKKPTHMEAINQPSGTANTSKEEHILKETTETADEKSCYGTEEICKNHHNCITEIDVRLCVGDRNRDQAADSHKKSGTDSINRNFLNG